MAPRTIQTPPINNWQLTSSRRPPQPPTSTTTNNTTVVTSNQLPYYTGPGAGVYIIDPGATASPQAPYGLLLQENQTGATNAKIGIINNANSGAALGGIDIIDHGSNGVFIQTAGSGFLELEAANSIRLFSHGANSGMLIRNQPTSGIGGIQIENNSPSFGSGMGINIIEDPTSSGGITISGQSSGGMTIGTTASGNGMSISDTGGSGMTIQTTSGGNLFLNTTGAGGIDVVNQGSSGLSLSSSSGGISIENTSSANDLLLFCRNAGTASLFVENSGGNRQGFVYVTSNGGVSIGQTQFGSGTTVINCTTLTITPAGLVGPISISVGSATTDKVGFYGATPVVQAAHPTTLAQVITALANLGLTA